MCKTLMHLSNEGVSQERMIIERNISMKKNPKSLRSIKVKRSNGREY